MWGNIFRIFFSNGYSVVLGVTVLPWYLEYLGAESFSVYALSATISIILILFDGGFSKVLSRDVSLFRSNRLSGRSLFELINTLTVLLLFLCLSVLLLGKYSSSFIASSWLSPESTPLHVLQYGLELIFLTAGINLMASLPNEGLIGAEAHSWIYKWNIFYATTRHLGGLVLISMYQDIVALLHYLLILSVIHWLVFSLKFRSLFPCKLRRVFWLNWSVFLHKAELGWSIFASGVLSAVVRQADKIIFSGVLTLEMFSYYAIGAQVASALFMITIPVISVVTPRLTRLRLDDFEEMKKIYQQSSDLIMLIIIPVSVVLSLYSDFVLSFWFDGADGTDKISLVLSVLVPAYMVLCLSTMLRPLQIAHGNLRLHLLGSVIFFVVRIPCLYLGGEYWGIQGAIVSLLIINCLYFLCWPYVIHSRFISDIRSKWLVRVSLAIVFSFVIFSAPLLWVEAEDVSRIGAFFVCTAIFIFNVLGLILAFGRQHPVFVILKSKFVHLGPN